MVSVGDEEPAMVVANLRKALAEIDELSAERASIEEALKEERNRDNILPKLMASSGRSDKIFNDELKKYDELKVGTKPSAVSAITGVMLFGGGSGKPKRMSPSSPSTAAGNAFTVVCPRSQ